MIPKPQCFDTLLLQKVFPGIVTLNFFRQAVLKTIKLDRQFCVSAIKIQNMSANRVLPAKFETGKLPSAQRPPKLLLFVGLIAAKRTGDLLQAHDKRMK
jgi:hypothetical protein